MHCVCFYPRCARSLSDGTLKGAQRHEPQPLGHVKDRFPDFQKRVYSLELSGKLKLSEPNITALHNRRNMAKILLTRRKTQIKQSIN
jgi:hypothetical protein